MFVHLTIYNLTYSLPKIIKYSIESTVFSIFMGFQNAKENGFHGFGNSVFCFEKVLEMSWKRGLCELCMF